jgi:argininosuccinate lyase
VDRVLARRKVAGGTAPARVRAEVKAWRKKLGPAKTARSKR